MKNKLFIANHLFINSNGEFKQTKVGLKKYIEIKYLFEKSQQMITRSIWLVILLIIVTLCMLLMFLLIIVTLGISLIFLPIICWTTKTIYKINFFEVKIYENGKVTKELNTHDFQCMYFKATNKEEIDSFEDFTEFAIHNCLSRFSVNSDENPTVLEENTQL